MSCEGFPMASFGENLRREREMRGVSLEEISAATKISVRFLEALEVEAFSKLPGGIFTRGFIRAYAKYLGLDEERVLAEYQLVAQPKADVDLSRMNTGMRGAEQETSRAPFLALAVAGMMLAGAYFLFRYAHTAPEQRANSLNPAPGSTAPPSAVPQHPAPTGPAAMSTTGMKEPAAKGSTVSTSPGTPALQDVEGSPGSRTASAPSTPKLGDEDGGLVLQVAATEKAWIAVDADGKTTRQRVFAPNDVETFKAKEYFDVTTGNARGTILTLNGEMLKPLGRHGESKKVHLTHDDLKNLVP